MPLGEVKVMCALGHAGCFYSCYYENFVSDKSYMCYLKKNLGDLMGPSREGWLCMRAQGHLFGGNR